MLGSGLEMHMIHAYHAGAYTMGNGMPDTTYPQAQDLNSGSTSTTATSNASLATRICTGI
jgi:hypothetical protein